MGDLIQFLRDLIASGQFGIVIIVLLVIIAGAVFVIWSERQTTARFVNLMKAMELNMRAADTAREQSIAAQKDVVTAQKDIMSAQKEVGESIKKQYEIVIKTNEELRMELERYEKKQAIFEDEVKQSISIGIRELRDMLARVTVNEIISQIPESFRQDLEKEMSQVADRTIQSVIDNLKNVDGTTVANDDFLARTIEKAVQATASHIFPPHFREEAEFHMRREGRLPPEFYRKYGYPVWDENTIDFLAQRIAERIRRW